MGYVDALSLPSQYFEIFVEEAYGAGDLPAEPTIIDCGANVGLATAWFKLKYPGASITAFEADPRIARVLRANLERLSLPGVAVVNAAVAAGEGTLGFAADGGMGGHVDPSGSIEVEAVRLSQYVDGTVHLLKLDIEGSEFEVVRELVSSGKMSLVERVVCEVHCDAQHPERFAGLLSDFGGAGFAVAIRWAEPWYGDRDVPIQAFPFFRGERAGFVLHLYAWREASGRQALPDGRALATATA
jgi:FkbM family methyltransferase